MLPAFGTPYLKNPLDDVARKYLQFVDLEFHADRIKSSKATGQQHSTKHRKPNHPSCH